MCAALAFSNGRRCSALPASPSRMTECLDKEIEFGTWVRRMRSSDATTARLKEMLRDQPLGDFLKPHDTGSEIVFTLKEGIIIGKKPR